MILLTYGTLSDERSPRSILALVPARLRATVDAIRGCAQPSALRGKWLIGNAQAPPRRASMSASAFVRRDVPSRLFEPLDAVPMQPLDSNLLPRVFSSAFGLPVTRFDQSDASLAGVAPVFKLPLPFAVRFLVLNAPFAECIASGRVCDAGGHAGVARPWKRSESTAKASRDVPRLRRALCRQSSAEVFSICVTFAWRG